MANERIQKVGYGSDRTVINEAVVEEREPVYNVGLNELILEYDSNTFHWPSEERLLKGLPVAPDTEDAETGSELISVNCATFLKLTATNRNLQQVIAEIDIVLNTLSTAPGTGDIKKDGSIDMEAAWNCQRNVTIGNTEQVQTVYKTTTINEYSAGDLVVNGDATIADTDDLSFDILTDGAFNNDTLYWQVGGSVIHFTIASGKATFSGTGSSKIIQTNGNLDTSSATIKNNAWYLFEYTVSNPSGPLNQRVRINNFPFIAFYLFLDMTAGTHKVLFKSNSSAKTANFEILVESGATASFDLDNLSLKETLAGSLDVVNNLNVGNKINDALEIDKNESNKIIMWPDTVSTHAGSSGWVTLKPIITLIDHSINTSEFIQQITVPSNHTILLETYIIALYRNTNKVNSYKRMMTAYHNGTQLVFPFLKEEAIYEQLEETHEQTLVKFVKDISSPHEIKLMVRAIASNTNVLYTVITKYMTVNKKP